MLYSDDTIMDSTIGSDMDSTSGRTGRVFIKLCCIGRNSPFPVKKHNKKAISALFMNQKQGKI